MLSSRPGKITNGRPSIMLPIREDEWYLTMGEVRSNNKAGIDDPAQRKDFSRNIDPIQAITSWPLTIEQHSTLLQIEALSKIALERGEVLRHGRFLPYNSFGTFPASLLALVFPDGLSHTDAHATLSINSA